MDTELNYVHPCEAFRFCKEYPGPLVTLRQDYCVKTGVVPFDATFYVHKSEIACRKLLAKA